ncbi:MAG: D-cysteine desulfhydrase family protein [Chloroflexi bacterium]|nr:D-cysteine desulfhydrase family protein [Chloroflexota bacterium]
MLSQRLDAYPRLPLGDFPTPLQPLPRLSDWMGRPIYIKRDDLPGPTMGGNKVRKLEYLMAEALSLGARKVVTFGGLQSNHARLTAAAAVQCGIEPHLFYFERRPRQLSGNLVINELLGAKMHFIPFGGGGNASMTLEKSIRLVRLVARIVTGPHYFIPVGGHSWLGCLGYVRAALEIDAQAREMGLERAWVVLAAGTGGTLAGLMAGFALLNSPLQLLALDVGKLWLAFPASIARLAGEICAQLGTPRTFSAQNVPLIEGIYTGKRYGVPSPAGMAAVKLLARTEGILLDPIYTAKACAGMLDLIKRGRLGGQEPVIFVHTGGLPGLFAFPTGFVP